MNAITFAVHKKNGAYVKTTVAASNRSQETRFGAMDVAIVVFFLITASGFFWLLLAR
jgi:hypothetical protein